MGLQAAGRKAIQTGVDTLAPFSRGSVSGENYKSLKHGLSMGQLPEEYKATLRQGLESGPIVYVVYSFRTPIAWGSKIGVDSQVEWTIPAVTYSNTTTHHQSIVRTATTVPGFYS